MMRELVTSGRIVDLVLGLVAIEALVLALHHRWTNRGIAGADAVANLASGACLLLALRAALSGASWVWIAALLGASLVGHLVDLARRWRGAPGDVRQPREGIGPTERMTRVNDY